VTENLLNQLLPYTPSVQPGYFIAGGIFFALFILLRIYNDHAKKTIARKEAAKKALHKAESPKAEHPGTVAKPRLQTPDKKELKQVIAEYGFKPEQAEYFTRLCVSNLVGSPRHLVENISAFDELMSDTIRRLQSVVSPTRETERQKTMLFTIREIIENHKRVSAIITSTRALQNGQPFTLITGKEEHYPSIIVINSPSGLLCKVPRDIFGNELRLPIWSKTRALFYTRAGQAYQFSSRIIRYESGKNETMMLIAHTNSVKAFPNRRHDRKSLRTPCTFAHVTVANIVNGKNTEHKFYPANKNFPGTILDISSGGCSIETPVAGTIGEYVSIQCILEGKTEDTIIGKIIRITPKEDNITMMHVQFAKMPRATMNRIFAYIYNYGER